jgi:hypothetical protein
MLDALGDRALAIQRARASGKHTARPLQQLITIHWKLRFVPSHREKFRLSSRDRKKHMQPITTDRKREIVDDFARAIQEKKTPGSKPAMTVINFRNEKIDGIERPIERVPLDLLRYRKDNGRIASDFLTMKRVVLP